MSFPAAIRSAPDTIWTATAPLLWNRIPGLTALAFQIDPELGEMDTPNGHMVFLQAVGITADELEAVMCWNTGKFLAELEKTCPMGIVDLSVPPHG